MLPLKQILILASIYNGRNSHAGLTHGLEGEPKREIERHIAHMVTAGFIKVCGGSIPYFMLTKLGHERLIEASAPFAETSASLSA